jgi:hypothetical protein
MASDPLAGYAPSAPDPLSGYQPTAPPASAREILEPRSLSQVGTDIGNFGRVAANTYGQGDTLMAGLRSLYGDVTGQGSNLPKQLTAERSQTAQAAQDIGTPGTIAASMIGAGPVGGGGKAIGEAAAPYLGKYLGGVAGAAGEGALVAGAGAAGRGDDIGKSMAMGGAGGAAVGSAGGVVGRGTQPAVDTADQLAAKASAKYDQADSIQLAHPAVVQAVQNAQNAIAQQSPRIALEGKGASNVLSDMLSESAQTGGLSAARLKDYSGKLQASETGDKVPVAGQIGQAHIDNLIQSNPQAAKTLGDANALYGQSQDMGRLDNWQQKAAVAGGPDVATQARGYLTSERGQDFAPPGSPTYQALNTLAGQGSKGSYLPYWAKHYVMAPIAGLAAGEAAQAVTGEPSSVEGRVGEDMAMALAFGGGGALYKGGTGASASAAQQRAIDAARATIGTGALQQPLGKAAPLRDLLQQLYVRQAAGGKLPTN